MPWNNSWFTHKSKPIQHSSFNRKIKRFKPENKSVWPKNLAATGKLKSPNRNRVTWSENLAESQPSILQLETHGPNRKSIQCDRVLILEIQRWGNFSVTGIIFWFKKHRFPVETAIFRFWEYIFRFWLPVKRCGVFFRLKEQFSSFGLFLALNEGGGLACWILI